MAEISFLTESDRAHWEVLARGYDAHSAVERGDDAYDQTWRRLLDGEQARGIAARLDGRMVGIAHYVFHAGIWGAGRCYLADLFVAADARRRGAATAMITWVARDAGEQGFPRLYWNALDDSPARGLYDKVAEISKGLVVYTYRRDASQNSTRR
ncbi:GNAT family N-acetyltransferase [Actinokineospora iranica]|uniref:Acetyltransferase (GNAT) family protein n=1 Tax=Actinokineospora iranica TaxID=1271860 RepID=A0A1G6Z2Z4_9PSEU|nr:GNAT family N-acetyltransferase [Actinokineospora iranica]SDD96901.1 Acetyltransferase (GNAT) family protein [Actinokineospora iranica]